MPLRRRRISRMEEAPGGNCARSGGRRAPSGTAVVHAVKIDAAVNTKVTRLPPGVEIVVVYAQGGDYITREQLDWYRKSA